MELTIAGTGTRRPGCLVGGGKVGDLVEERKPTTRQNSSKGCKRRCECCAQAVAVRPQLSSTVRRKEDLPSWRHSQHIGERRQDLQVRNLWHAACAGLCYLAKVYCGAPVSRLSCEDSSRYSRVLRVANITFPKGASSHELHAVCKRWYLVHRLSRTAIRGTSIAVRV